MGIIRETLDLWSAWLPQRNSHTIKIIKSILWNDQVEYLVLNFHFNPQGWSNRPFTMIKLIILFWPSTDDQFDYLEGCPIVDHHIWSTWPSRYSGWPSIFIRVSTSTRPDRTYNRPKTRNWDKWVLPQERISWATYSTYRHALSSSWLSILTASTWVPF